MDAAPPSEDQRLVREFLGRDPQGAYRVVVRSARGEPVVIENAPLLDDGTPMPTRYWLIGPAEVRAVSRLEASGGVRRAETEIDPAAVAEAHTRYAEIRDAEIPVDHTGPVPTGGVGGTRTGIKCLHAHYAWHLAGGADPVGAWVARQLGRSSTAVRIDRDRCTLYYEDHSLALIDPAHPLITALGHRDPPAPEDLSNAIGVIQDSLIDLGRQHPGLLDEQCPALTGPLAHSLACVEVGLDRIPAEIEIGRDALEEVFRTLVTEPRRDRLANPGLPPDDVDAIVMAACVAVAVTRTLSANTVTVRHSPEPSVESTS